jgi:ABC-type transport system substrate-binding protein
VRRGTDDSKPARLAFTVIPDDQARLDSFQRGGTDVLRLCGPMIGEATLTEGGKLAPKPHMQRGAVSVFQANELSYNVVNWQSPKLAGIDPAQRPHVLRAFSAALDRAKLVAELLPSGCAEATASVAPPMTGAKATAAMSPPPSGTPSVPQGLTLLAANDSASRQIAVAMQKQLAANGIKVETEFTDLGALIGRLVKKEFDVVAGFWIELQIVSSGPFAWCSFFDKNAPLSAFGEPRDDVGVPLAEGRGILDPAARAAAYRRVVSLIDERQESWVPLMSRKAVFLHDKAVRPWLDINGTPAHGLIRQQP